MNEKAPIMRNFEGASDGVNMTIYNKIVKDFIRPRKEIKPSKEGEVSSSELQSNRDHAVKGITLFESLLVQSSVL